MRSRAEGQGADMQKNWAKALGFALTLVMVMTGCGGEDEASGKPTAAEFENERGALANRDKAKAAKKVAKKGKKAGKSAAPSASSGGYAAAAQDYFYDPRGKRDPFRSFRFVVDEDSADQEMSGPLGDFELGQLELAAVIWDAGNPRALIMDPGGRSFIVREGDPVGKNSGQVIHIGDSLVLVKETYENFAGEQTTKDVELRISLSQGG